MTIEPGDVLLYRGRGLFAWAIRVKTWQPVSHCELANSGASAFASRSGGVHTYAIDLDPKRLYAVLRPAWALDMAAVRRFHSGCVGQRYDWFGLFRFFVIGKQSQAKQFCSEYVMRLLRAGGLEPFTPGTDADLVAPGQFFMSPNLDCVWRKDHELAGAADAVGTVTPAPDAAGQTSSLPKAARLPPGD